MHIKITGDRCLFAHLLQGKNLDSNVVPFIMWDVNGGIPLGHPRNLESLSSLLARDALDDIVIFLLDQSTGTPTGDPIDPSLSSFELRLQEGAMVYLTVNPCAYFDDPSKAFWVPLSTSSVRFEDCGEALSITGVNKRRIVKFKPDGWDDAVGIANINLHNDEINKWTFRISTVDAIKGNPEGAEGEGSLYSFLGSDKAGGEGNNSNDGGRVVNDSFSPGAGHEDTNQTTDDNDDGAGSDKSDEDDAVTTTTAGAPVKEPMRGDAMAFPVVMVGVADDSVPLDDTKVFSNYQRCFMLDVGAGAFYAAADKRPTYVDRHNYRIFHGMVITFMLETERGVLNVVVNGQNVLAANITRYLAESMYPVVEIYSSGTVVDLM